MEKLYPTLKARAREMRKAPTEAEERLWSRLRAKRFEGLKFHRQYPAGSYILDFYCPEKRLAVELDGGRHADPAQEGYDETRSRELSSLGIRVIRFWNDDVLKDTDAVMNVIGREAGIF